MANVNNRTMFEVVSSGSDSDVQVNTTGRSNRRRMVVGSSVGLGVASAVVLWRSYGGGGCKELATLKGDSLVSLAENYPEDLAQLGDADDDMDARKRWLQEASEARYKANVDAMLPGDPAIAATLKAAMDSTDPKKAKELLQKALEQAKEGKVPMGDKMHDAVEAAMAAHDPKKARELMGSAISQAAVGGADPKIAATIAAAMDSDDPEKAKELVAKAMAQAVEQSKTKRRELKAYIKANRRSLQGKAPTTPSPRKQKQIATCTFDILSLMTTTAGIAANLNDAAKTCWGVHPEDLVNFGIHGKAYIHTNVCSVNVWAILGSIIGLSQSLAGASSDCAATMIPNVQALCASAIIGTVTAVASMGGATTLIKAACHAKGWYHDIGAGALPSNIGSNELWVDEHPERQGQYRAEMAKQAAMGAPVLAAPAAAARRLEEGPAPARQLLFGGGKGSTATQCTIELAGSMWALAGAGMAIDGAAGHNQDGNCPPKNFLTGSEKPSNGILYRVPQAMCTIDVTGAILGFLSAITYLQLASVNCIDTLHIGAICGAGIAGLMAAATGLAKAGAGMYVACDIAQKKPLKKTINLVRNVDMATGGMITKLVDSGALSGETAGENVLGRRLADDEHEQNILRFGRRLNEDEQLMVDIAEQNIAELKTRFATPHEALASIGFDIEDPKAAWRNMTAGSGMGLDVHDFASLTALFKEPEEAASLFGTADCKSEPR